MWRYLKEAFWAKATLPAVGPLPVNALAVLGVGILGCAEHALWLFGAGLEMGYLYLLATNPRFQRVISARESAQLQNQVEQSRRRLLDGLRADERAQLARQEDKVRQVAEVSRGTQDDDPLLDSNVGPLRQLCELYLRLLAARRGLLGDGSSDQETEFARLAADQEQELARSGARFSESLRESKQATLEITRKRLENARRRRESLEEIESDLLRIEAQLDLALENARLAGKPALVNDNLNLLNRILESNRSLHNLDEWMGAGELMPKADVSPTAKEQI